MAVGATNYPAALDDATSLIRVVNIASSTIGAGGVTNVATTVPVTDTTTFASDGVAWCGTEAISYTGKTGTTLTGCVRGFDSTTAASHAAGDPIYGDIITSAHHEALRSAVIALETALGPTDGAMAARALKDRGGQVYNAVAYGADPTGGVDCATALAAAHTALPGNGGTIFLPAGVYSLSSVTFTKTTRLVGAGAGATTIIAADATSNVITLNALFCSVEQLSIIAGVTRTAGAFIYLPAGGSHSLAEHVAMNGHYIGVRCTADAGSKIQHSTFYNGATTTGSCGILVDGGNVTYIDSVTMDASPAAMPKAGIKVTATGCINLSNANIMNQGDDLLIAPTVDSGDVYCINSFFDSAVRGIVIDVDGTVGLGRCRFVGCWTASHTGHGIVVDGAGLTGAGYIELVEFTNHHSILNAGNGMMVLGTKVDQVNVVGGQFSNNAGYGFEAGTGVGRFSLIGVKLGSTLGRTGNAYGVVLNGTNDNYRIIGCDLDGNTVSPAFGVVAGTATKRMIGNIPNIYDELPVPGGSTTQVQFNDAGVLSGDAQFLWDKTNNRLRLGTNTANTGGLSLPNEATNGGIYARNGANSADLALMHLGSDDSLYLRGGQLSVGGNITSSPNFSASGYVWGNVRDLGGQVVNVLAYGAAGNGTTDDTAAFVAAHAALPAQGGTIYMPPGSYKISTLSLTKATRLQGAGVGATKIIAGDATSNVIVFSTFFCSVESVLFDTSVTRTAGAYVHFTTGASHSHLRDFVMQGYYTGVRMSADAGTRVQSGSLYNGATSAGSCGMLVDAGNDTYIDSITMDAPAISQPTAGIKVTSTGALNITNCAIIRHTDCLLITPSVSSGDVYCINTYFDSAVRGIVIAPTGTVGLGRCRFVGCWASSHTGHGVTIDGTGLSGAGYIETVEFYGLHAILNGGDGMRLSGGVVDSVQLHGGQFSANTGSGFRAESGVGNFLLSGVTSGVTTGRAGNAYGIYLAGTNNNYRIIGVDCQGNTTANFFGVSTSDTQLTGLNLPSVSDDNVWCNHFMPAADGSAISTIADMFGANSAFPVAAAGRYLVEARVWYRKTTAGTVTFTLTNTQTPVNVEGWYVNSAAAGMGTAAAPLAAGIEGSTSAATALPATASLTTNTDHYVEIVFVFTGHATTAGNARLRVAASAGSVTLQRGSYFRVQRLPAGNVGTFVA